MAQGLGVRGFGVRQLRVPPNISPNSRTFTDWALNSKLSTQRTCDCRLRRTYISGWFSRLLESLFSYLNGKGAGGESSCD